MSLDNLAVSLAGVGRPDKAASAREAAGAGLAPAVAARLGVLRVAWEWVGTPTCKAERDLLLARPELLGRRREASRLSFSSVGVWASTRLRRLRRLRRRGGNEAWPLL
jgi:hypothetical protein